MPEIDPVILQLRADVSRYQADIRNTTRSVQSQLDAQGRSVITLEHQMEASTRNIASSIGTLRKTLLSSASLLAGAFGANELKQLADGYTSFTNRLKVAGLEGQALAATQEQLFVIAQKYGQELESVGGLYGGASAAAKELGASQGDLIKFTNGVSAALKIQGGSAASSAGALGQLSQLLGGTNVQAQEFNSINDGARPVLQAVASGIDRYGGSIAKLRAEVVEGKLTSKEFFEGFLSGSTQLEAQAAKANLTIAASFTVLNNALGKYIGETDQALSITARVSGMISTLADNLDTLVPALAVVSVGLGARFLAGNAALQALTTSTLVHIKALDQEKVVMLGGAVAAAQKAEATAAGARVEVAAIEATIAARRQDSAAIAATLAAIEAQRAAALQSQAAMAANARLGFGTAVGYGRNDAARATQDHRALLVTRRALAGVNAELAASEAALVAAQARAATATTASTAAAAAATVTARAAAAATKLFSGALTLIGGSVGGGAAVLAIGAIIGAILYFRSEARHAREEVTTFNENTAKLKETLAETAQYGARAANEVGAVGSQATAATPGVRAFAGAVGEAADKLFKLAQARRKEAIESLRARETTANQDQATFSARFVTAKDTTLRRREVGPGTNQVSAEGEAARQRAQVAATQARAARTERERLEALPLTGFLSGSEREGGRDVEGDLARVTRDLTVARKRGIRSTIDSLEAQKYELTQYKAYRKQGLSPQAAQEASSRDASALRNAAAGAQGDRDAKAGRSAKGKADREAAALARKQVAEARDTAADNRAFAAAERQVNNEIASAKADLSGSAEERASIEKARIDAERISRNDEIAEQAKQGRFGEGAVAKARVLELQALNDQRAALEDQVVDLHERQRIDRETLELRLAGFDNERDLLSEQSRLADTATNRTRIEFQLLDLARKEEEARLRAVLATNSLASEAEKKAAVLRLAKLPEIYEARAEQVRRDTESPGQRYRRQVNRTAGQIAEDLESVSVDGLERLNDGLADALTGAKSLGDVFHDVTGSIIRDLLRIAIQQTLIKPLANALFGDGQEGGSGGALGGLFASAGRILSRGGSTPGYGGAPLPGRASGGFVGAGQLVRVNEGASPGRMEGFRPVGSGTVIPLGQMQAQRPAAGTTLHQTINVDARGGVNPTGYAEHIKASVRQETAALIDANNKGLRSAMPAAQARLQKLGTTG